MTLTIYTNFDALRMQRSLESNQAGLARTLQRLSSGVRVGSAADDAAGLAVATRMESQIRGMNQGVRNASDAISAVQTADAQLTQLNAILQRARELSVQAANGIYGGAERTAMDRELQQVMSEFDRIAASTSFNGRALLDGSAGAALYQIGANATDTVGFNWNTSMRRTAQGALEMLSSTDLRTAGFQFAGTYTTPPIANLNFSIPASPFRGGSITTAGAPASNYAGNVASFDVDGTTVALNSNYGSLGGVAGAVQAQLSAAHSGWYTVGTSGGNITITKNASAAGAPAAVSISNGSGANAAAFTSGTAVAGAAAVTATFAGFSVDGHSVYIDTNFSGNDGGLIADIQGQLDAVRAISGLYQVSGSAAGISISRQGNLVPPGIGSFVGTGATVFAQAAPSTLTLGLGDLQVQMGTGASVDIVGSFATPDALARAIMQKVPGLYVSVDSTTGVMKLTSAQKITVAGAQSDSSGALGFTSSTSQTTGNLGQVNLFNASSAVEVLMRVDVAMESVNQTRATLGALQNRLDSAISNLQNSSLQLTSARGRIMDADYAQELSHKVKSQILQQAGLAMVARAALLPRTVLALLR